MEATEFSNIFDGKYIALSLVEDSLTLLNREIGELTEIDYKYEMSGFLNTFAWNDLGQLAVLQQTDKQAAALSPDHIKEITKRVKYPARNKKGVSQVWGEKASARVITGGRIMRVATSCPGVKRA